VQKRIKGYIPTTLALLGRAALNLHDARSEAAGESAVSVVEAAQGGTRATGRRRRFISCRAPLRSAGTPAADSALAASRDSHSPPRFDRSALILYSLALLLSHLRASRLVVDLEGFASCTERYVNLGILLSIFNAVYPIQFRNVFILWRKVFTGGY
jgi:hypothetical protein